MHFWVECKRILAIFSTSETSVEWKRMFDFLRTEPQQCVSCIVADDRNNLQQGGAPTCWGFMLVGNARHFGLCSC